MINGATQIIAGVPGKHLDPLLLARSQSRESVGFIMISYQRQSANQELPLSRFYDLLFFRGPDIFECARLNQDLRFQLHEEAAFQTFSNFGREEGTRIFLFLAPDELLHRFRSTFYYEPCLKVKVKSLSKKQIVTLLKSTGCQRGIIECNEFTQLAPSLELSKVSSPDDIIQYQPKFRHGRILLYDTEKNKELVQERYSAFSKRLTHPAGERLPNDEMGETISRPSIHIFDSSKKPEAIKPEPSLDEKQAEELSALIKEILNSPVSQDSGKPRTQNSDDKTFVITRKDTTTNRIEEHQNSDDRKFTRRAGPRSSHVSRNRQTPVKTKPKPASLKPTSDLPSQKTGDSPSVAAGVDDAKVSDQSIFIKLFERLFRSFRQQIFDCYGDKSEAIITDAEHKVRFLTPEFDLHSLKEVTAIVMLDLIETIANDAPFFKRSKLREAALTLVADLYNKQYELLEQKRVLEKVEQSYYRLKK